MRGGGGGFGVVTAFEFELHPFGPSVLAGSLIYRPEDAPGVFRNYASYIADAPRAVRPSLGLLELPEAPFYPEAVHHERVLLVVLCYAGDPSAGEAALNRSTGARPSEGDAATGGVPESLQELDQTPDIDVIYTVIERTTPADVHLESPVTEVRSDGSRSRDPSWADSTSGTRLAEFEDGWMWREGELPLDALQVVALEEGILSNPREYPRGSDWWAAVDALRDRGVPIPELVSE
jgi:hypothetical protein